VRVRLRVMKKLAGGLIGWFALCCTAAQAHVFPYSTLEFRVTPRALEGRLTGNVISFAHPLGMMDTARLLERGFVNQQQARLTRAINSKDAGLRVTGDGRSLTATIETITIDSEKKTLSLQLRWHWQRPPSKLAFHYRLFAVYDPAHEGRMLLTDADGATTQNLFTEFAPRFTYWRGTRQAKWAVARAYVREGLHHIFTGYDHIAFVLGLLLLGGTLGRLTKIVTAFTLAHSITLSLAALNVVNLSPKFVEPAIALSIAYIGADNLVADPDRDWRARVAFLFGFLHGFGFAGLLREIGLPQRALGLSLFSFNLGVEIGQVAIVLLVAPLLAALRNRNVIASKRLTVLGSWALVAAGGYWFVQRMWFDG